MVKGASGNLQKEKIINKRKHAGRRPIGIKYFEARMVYRLHYIGADLPVYFFEKFDRQNCFQFGDEASSIILNTACSPEKVPQPLKPLFEYINDPTKGSGDALVDDIDRQVSRFNTDEWRRRHMTLQELMDRNYEQGLEKGIEQGLEKGRAEGEFEAARKLARNFKNAGISAETIAENTGLSLAEIEKL